MRFNKCALLCAILALSILEPITARKTFGSSSRHSYPKSNSGLSGHGGSHSYPSSGGLSGGGHGYPSSGGSHGYPSSGGSHGYPSSGGLSGGGRGTSGGSHTYPSSGGSHTYPSSGNSGSHGYPSSGGLSGNNNRGNARPATTTTNVHHHYHYSPPQQISYSPYRGAAPVSYPVYHGTPPTYVYQYKDSGSKYGTLLAGLALLNLGTLAGTAYAISKSNGNSHNSYQTQPGELCKFGLKKGSDYEETKIDCQLISSFILQEQAKTQGNQHNTTSTITTTVTNVTMVNNTNPVDSATGAPVNQTVTKVLYEMLPNGTLVPVNVPMNVTDNATTINPPAGNNNTMTSSVVTTITNTTTVTNALDVKGKPVEVTPDMECYVIRTTPSSRMRKSVPCGLLQTYADKSIQKNSAVKSLPTFTILTIALAAFVFN